MVRNNKGFTLIELLAVIVILGLLMAIAIPSVTKYITQSRIKTLVKSVDSYVTSVTTQVNNGDYHFSDETKIFAIPIECVALEKGGTNPFGNWLQANAAYWAYVLVQYDSENYNYKYGFVFKDDAGYGMYPTVSESIVANGNQIKTGYDDLNKPVSGLAIDFISKDKWTGFNIVDTTELVVLEAESEGKAGDGKETCTLCQKGSNYDDIEAEKAKRQCRVTSGSGYNIGDVITCNTESFYVLEVDDTTITMLSKLQIDLTTHKQGTAMQYEYFANTVYWNNSKYGNNYPAFVYDSNANSYVHVKAYESFLKSNTSLKSASASLISYDKLLELGCQGAPNYTCENSPYKSFIKLPNGTYWTGTAVYRYYRNVWSVQSNGVMHHNWTNYGLVRPTVTALKSEIIF